MKSNEILSTKFYVHYFFHSFSSFFLSLLLPIPPQHPSQTIALHSSASPPARPPPPPLCSPPPPRTTLPDAWAHLLLLSPLLRLGCLFPAAVVLEGCGLSTWPSRGCVLHREARRNTFGARGPMLPLPRNELCHPTHAKPLEHHPSFPLFLLSPLLLLLLWFLLARPRHGDPQSGNGR